MSTGYRCRPSGRPGDQPPEAWQILSCTTRSGLRPPQAGHCHGRQVVDATSCHLTNTAEPCHSLSIEPVLGLPFDPEVIMKTDAGRLTWHAVLAVGALIAAATTAASAQAALPKVMILADTSAAMDEAL